MKAPLVTLILLACVVFTPRAQNGVFFMELPPETLPLDVGANAFTVVGAFYDLGGLSWMPTSGTTDLGGISADAVSLDGKIIAGRALDANRLENAAIYQGRRNWRVLGSIGLAQPCDRNLSATFGASEDGKVIVGLAWDSCRIARAFRWEESTGMVDLGSTNANSTRANGVSGDGRVVLGWQESEVGFRQGAKWINNQQETIRNSAGRVVGEARAANRNGSVIVGQRCDAFNPDPTHPDTQAAWKWTTTQGGVRCFPVSRPQTLPDLPYAAMMLSTSDDGRVIGGAFSFGLDSESVLWLDDQPYFLRDYLRDNGVPDAFRRWVNTGFITGVSPDGRTLVGYGAGPAAFQGFLVVLPERGSR